MKANYKPRFVPGMDEARAIGLSARDERIAGIVWQEAQRQFEAEKEYVTEAVLASVLCALNDRYHWKGDTLVRVYKDAVTLIAGLRFDLCEDHKRRKVGELGEELVALIEQLRVNGLDMKALESACRYDPETGVVTWRDEV